MPKQRSLWKTQSRKIMWVLPELRARTKLDGAVPRRDLWCCCLQKAPAAPAMHDPSKKQTTETKQPGPKPRQSWRCLCDVQEKKTETRRGPGDARLFLDCLSDLQPAA
mmetsp:Transcript_73314/g.185701  ORF Transcript_73314/g.185701 Transcript_73314/m.185701 type:complete len:108 (+) Transcript_73314:45-368(+)